MQRRDVIGLMSGTSADGIDAVLAQIRGQGLSMTARVVKHKHILFPRTLRKRLHRLQRQRVALAEIRQLDLQLAERFALAALKVSNGSRRPVLIGSHGQTVLHLPGNHTVSWQLGDGATIAAKTGITTVADFRSADTAAGGQGAPLVPWTDYVLLRSPAKTRLVQNIGGIANLTYLPAGGTPTQVRAFDTGPGNMLIDATVEQLSGGRRLMDHRGSSAAKGDIARPLLRRWLRWRYFSQPPPKSTGREAFGEEVARRLIIQARRGHLSACDTIATVTALTAHSIADAIKRYLPQRPRIDEMIVCGGGCKNDTLLRMLAEAIAPIEVVPIDRFGLASEQKEPLSFALLAVACADRVPANLEQVTGATRPAILGAIYHA